jgi:hypothetical protein
MSKNYTPGWRVDAVPEIHRAHGIYDNSGILAIECRATGELLIFSASNISTRLKWHFGELLKKRHPNEHLQSTYNQYGVGGFTWRVLELCASSELASKKLYWVNAYSEDRLFNTTWEIEALRERLKT